MKVIDVRDGETEDEARERHELANARAAVAHVDRVLSTHALREERDAALAEVASLREENARLASGGRRGASGVVHREFHKQIVEKLQSERDAALSSSRAWWRKALELQDRAGRYRESAKRLRDFAAMLLEDVHHLERDCAVARAKDLEAALEEAMGTFLGIYNSCVVSLDGPGPHALSNSIRPRAQAAACKLGEALHPPPPSSASDRTTGTEHHDAATEPEDGCQAGARRP